MAAFSLVRSSIRFINRSILVFNISSSLIVCVPLEDLCGLRTGGWSLPSVMSD
jgi:hypothetical protein